MNDMLRCLPDACFDPAGSQNKRRWSVVRRGETDIVESSSPLHVPGKVIVEVAYSI